MQETISVCGSIDKILFQDIESGFIIFILSREKAEAITIKGNLPNLKVGQEVTIDGKWIIDPKYGRQFEAHLCRFNVAKSITGLKRFLGSGLIKGIGKVYAERLVNYFGAEVLEIIDKNPQRLYEVDGLGGKRIESIIAAWQENKEISNIMVFLQERSISPAIAIRLYKKYKQNTIDYILQNPYRLAEEVWGIGFKTADEIAQKLGFLPDSEYRITAGIIFALTSAMQSGHLYTEVEELKKNVYLLLQLEKNQDNILKIKNSLHTLYDQEKIKLITKENKHFLGTAKCYNAEINVAKKINYLLKEPARKSFDMSSLYQELNLGSDKIILTENQIKGILTCLQNKITIITGGPGTGKTTIIKNLLYILDRYKIKYKLAAPTGRAAKRISESTGHIASTIHRLLEVDPLSMTFKFNERNTLPIDFLIVDEASMIDIFLANSLIKALPTNAQLILIGDVDQLPAVGPGNFLNDCIASGMISCIRLNEVFRQAQDSLIIVNAHRINKGEFPTTFLPEARRDFLFIKDNNPANIESHLKKIFFDTLKKYSIKKEDAIVLTPMHRGLAGTHTINQQLQSFLNPEISNKLIFNGVTYKVGDRVMQIRNNYDKFVFNGDIGFIESVNEEERTAEIIFGERKLEYDFIEFNELVLSYAVSVHKSQGSEYPAVIVPIFIQHFTLLQRNLLYTAVTRAKKLCILIGEIKAIAIAIKNNKNIERITFLKSFIKETGSLNFKELGVQINSFIDNQNL